MSLLPPSSLLQTQVHNGSVGHIVVAQGIGVLDENGLQKDRTEDGWLHVHRISLTNLLDFEQKRSKRISTNIIIVQCSVSATQNS